MNQTKTYFCDKVPTKYHLANLKNLEEKKWPFLQLFSKSRPPKNTQWFDYKSVCLTTSAAMKYSIID